MHRDLLKIPKKLKQVTLWIHPEGRVVGSLFLRPQSPNAPREEEPLEVDLVKGSELALERRTELRVLRASQALRREDVTSARAGYA